MTCFFISSGNILIWEFLQIFLVKQDGIVQFIYNNEEGNPYLSSKKITNKSNLCHIMFVILNFGLAFINWIFGPSTEQFFFLQGDRWIRIVFILCSVTISWSRWSDPFRGTHCTCVAKSVCSLGSLELQTSTNPHLQVAQSNLFCPRPSPLMAEARCLYYECVEW